MLPEAFLNELKYNTDIEQVIGRYVQLRRRGKNLTGLCPFHSEKTPPSPSTRIHSPSTASAAGPVGTPSPL